MITIDCEYYICSCPLIALLLEISSALSRDCCQASLQESSMPVFRVCRFEISLPSGCCLFTLSSYQGSAEFFITVSLFFFQRRNRWFYGAFDSILYHSEQPYLSCRDCQALKQKIHPNQTSKQKHFEKLNRSFVVFLTGQPRKGN